MPDMKPWYFHVWGILLLILLTLVLAFAVALGIYVFKAAKTAKTSGFALTGQKYPAASGDHYWLGAANAPVTIVEFGDFACPYSEKSFPTIREISLKYKNRIKFVWRDYPVISDYSGLLALAGRCAGEQGLFWPMHDKLFQYQAAILNDQEVKADELTILAEQIGADKTRFINCLNQQKYLTQIQKDMQDGQAFGAAGTPTWFINGYKAAEGDMPYETFVKIINQQLK